LFWTEENTFSEITDGWIVSQKKEKYIRGDLVKARYGTGSKMSMYPAHVVAIEGQRFFQSVQVNFSKLNYCWFYPFFFLLLLSNSHLGKKDKIQVLYE
jgi:hypothetical protein